MPTVRNGQTLTESLALTDSAKAWKGQMERPAGDGGNDRLTDTEADKKTAKSLAGMGRHSYLCWRQQFCPELSPRGSWNFSPLALQPETLRDSFQSHNSPGLMILRKGADWALNVPGAKLKNQLIPLSPSPIPNLMGQEWFPHLPPGASGSAGSGKRLLGDHCESKLCGHSGQCQVEAVVHCFHGYQRMLSSN